MDAAPGRGILIYFPSDAAPGRSTGTNWEGICTVVGVHGIREQRNFIARSFPVGARIVSIDDDVRDVVWKHRAGNSVESVRLLPHGSLESLIFDAFHRMHTYQAFICGLNVSSNPCSMNMDGISTRNGEINGFFYCFVNRHAEDLLPC